MTTTLSHETMTARKAHRCSWCGQDIPVGEVYSRSRVIYEGEPITNKFHLECEAAADEIGRATGEWEFYPYENERPAPAVTP